LRRPRNGLRCYAHGARSAEKALDLSGGGTFYIAALGAAYAAAGRESDARAVLDRLAQLSVHGYVSPYHLSLIHLHLGERERALQLVLDAYAVRDAWVVWLGVEPQFDPLRGEPAFEKVLRDLRHPALYRKLAKRAAPKKRRRQDRIAPVTTQILMPAVDTQSGENEEARQLYTAGRYYSTRRTAEGLRQAIERFERAVELDPEYGIAHAELGAAVLLHQHDVEPEAEALLVPQ